MERLQAAYAAQGAAVADAERAAGQYQSAATQLEIELSKQIAASTRVTARVAALERHAGQTAGALAAANADTARLAWARTKSTAMADLEELKSQHDSLLFFRAQLRLFRSLAATVS
jgi:hypothetical protein